MDEKSTSIRMLSAAVALISLVGCATMNPEWSMALMNSGTNEIATSTIKCGRFYYRPGILPARISKGYYCDHEAIPETAVIRWQRKDGPWQERQVPVRSSIPRGFSGCIYFNIDDKDNVTIFPEPE